MYFEPRQHPLSGRERLKLRSILVAAENAVQRDPRMLAVSRTLEEAVMQRPDYADARRRNFGAYVVK